MKSKFPYSKEVQLAFKHEPPGRWMAKFPQGAIRLNSGYPDPRLVPSEEIKGAMARLLEEEKDLPLHYIGSPRIPQLEKFICQRMAERGAPTANEELLVTSGACQAIDLVARVLLDEEAVVAIESPTYMEALEIFQNYTDKYISIPIDENGMKTEKLEEILAERKRKGEALPRILYTIPTFQNPTGTTLSLERRKHLLKLAEQFDFLIMEDDAYGELGFAEKPQLLKALDAGERVIYIGSFSKVVAPGMRIGWAAGPKELIEVLGWFKKDLGHPFAQSTLSAYLETIDFDSHLKKLVSVYEAKARVMVEALEEFMPESAAWFMPSGGYFLWLQIPGVDTAELLSKAHEAGFVYVPGRFFFLDQQEGLEFLRLSFSYTSEENIREGIRLLGQILDAN
ncbi:2-aminoadipate transaminase [Planococcus massiliensis]|uniref:2-aminoadipate transaminase n=1 Tax=Planococcus massiliensis TaxID=1499687 RepID=A0A098EN30_9BACL|nr:PLP-dependent aminotransferase family protein [Planococcus massiliensis]CEG23699.1 2-aminoadipate transaminase [Planococcus massiliensis]